jgi:GT2 family glycosyltransferase
MPQVLVVVLNFRTADLTIDCLRSLAAEVDATAGVGAVVVDNASADGSVDRLKNAIRSNGWTWARLVELAHNGGYSAGNNAAIRSALERPDPPCYVLLLNPDTVVRPGAIASLSAFLDSHPKVGIVGARLEQPDGTPQLSAFRFPTITSELERSLRVGPLTRLLYGRWYVSPASASPTDWVAGAALMARRGVFESVGLLDEGYFLYYEDVDLCLQARRAGWSCWYVPEARVVHLVGRSTGVTDPRRRARRPAYWFDARRRYFTKNHGRLYALLADVAAALGLIGCKARCLVERKPDPDPPRLLADLVRAAIGPQRSGG